MIINGPNLNYLDKRNPKVYGTLSLPLIEKFLKTEFPSYDFCFFQSNHEGEIVDMIQATYGKFDGLIINPAGYSHTSIAIRDALEICEIPKVEVHLSNLAARDDNRQNLVTAAVCDGYISGFKEFGYYAAIRVNEKFLVQKDERKIIKK